MAGWLIQFTLSSAWYGVCDGPVFFDGSKTFCDRATYGDVKKDKKQRAVSIYIEKYQLQVSWLAGWLARWMIDLIQDVDGAKLHI
jgi:hypothetical protein